MTVSAEDVENAIRVVLNRAPRDAAEIADLQTRHDEFAGITLDLMRSKEAYGRIASHVRDFDQSLGDFSAVRTVFMHIPKTAGTTVRRALTANFSKRAIFADTNWLGTYPANVLAQHSLFMGHFTLHAIQHIPGDKRIFTLLRDPRERVLSFYRYKRAMLRARPQNTDRLSHIVGQSPEAFFADPEVRKARPIFNVQTRFLCCITPEIARKFGLDKPGAKPFRFASDIKLAAEIAKENLQRLAGFGLVEQFDEFLQHVFPMLGLKVPEKIGSANVTDRIGQAAVKQLEGKAEDSTKAVLSEELKRSLDELVEADQIVYDFASEMFRKRYLQSI